MGAHPIAIGLDLCLYVARGARVRVDILRIPTTGLTMRFRPVPLAYQGLAVFTPTSIQIRLPLGERFLAAGGAGLGGEKSYPGTCASSATP